MAFNWRLNLKLVMFSIEDLEPLAYLDEPIYRDGELFSENSHGAYSSCRWQHATLDCVKELKQEHDLEPEVIESVAVNSFAWVKTHEVYNPSDMVDAQFSIPYTVSMVLLGEQPGPAWYTPENMHSDTVARS